MSAKNKLRMLLIAASFFSIHAIAQPSVKLWDKTIVDFVMEGYGNFSSGSGKSNSAITESQKSAIFQIKIILFVTQPYFWYKFNCH